MISYDQMFFIFTYFVHMCGRSV